MFVEALRHRRGHDFYPTTTELANFPVLYSQDGKGLDATVCAHYFCAVGDWWITEFSRTFTRDGLAFGYARTGGQDGGALTYIYLPNLETVDVWPQVARRPAAARRGLPVVAVPVLVERDLYWSPMTVRQAIQRAAA